VLRGRPDGAPVASLILYRPSSGPAFSGAERLAVKAAGRYLSLNAGAATVGTDAEMYRVSGEDALLICEPDGRIARASGNAYALLAQASGCRSTARAFPCSSSVPAGS